MNFLPKFILVALFTSLMSGTVLAQSGDTLHIASFNIHYIVPGDEDDDWTGRRHAVTQVLKEMDADIIAFQEMETFERGHYSKRNLQLAWVHATVAGYETAATGNPELFPGTQPIIYRPDKYAVIDQGFFFFSKTPDVIYSEQWNGGFPYFCSWVRFYNKAAETDFYVFNIHNDYASRGNRLKTSRLLAERIEKIVEDDLPVILLGDFNAPKGFKEISLLKDVGLRVVPPDGSTNRIFGMNLLPAIDHILISSDLQMESDIKVWRKRYDGVYPGDHYPISVKLNFNSQ